MRIETPYATPSSAPTSSPSGKVGAFAELMANLSASGSKEEARRATVTAMREAAAGLNAKDFLRGLAPADLAILQDEAHLALPVQVESLSTEGAENLIRDKDNLVDLDHDGFVERGAGKLIVFPPVNAPDSVKDAWKAASAGMDRRDAAILELKLALPFTLPAQLGRTSDRVINVSAGSYDWGAHLEAAITGHEASKSANKATAAQQGLWERLAQGLKRLQQELQARGLA